MDFARLDWVLAKAQASVSLTAWEDEFINDLTDRRARYGDRIRISDRQEEILERISEKD
jgi:hypothetical protein